jgi:hypothetical protein
MNGLIFLRGLCIAFVFGSIANYGQCTYTSPVPYGESFMSIVSNNQLPTCWTASNIGSSCLTYSSSNNAFTGQKCAAFRLITAGTDYFFSNGIQLYSGVVYSVCVHYKIDVPASNWTDLSILIGQNPTSNSLTSLASTKGPASAISYSLLSNTFTVASTGIYYLAIKGTGVAGLAEYLYFDDVTVSIPCYGPGAVNVPTVGILCNNGFTTVPTTGSICAGPMTTLTAFGADTYTWANSLTTTSIIMSPTNIPNNSVVGTSTLTGCTGTASFSQVYAIPPMVISVPDKTICPGETTTLTVY